MHPELFHLGPLVIHTYGVIMAIGISVSLFLLSLHAKRVGLSAETMIDVGFVIVLSGLIGARLLYVMLHWRYYLARPVEIIMLQRGGLAILGAFILVPVTTLIFIRRKKLSFFVVADLVVPYIALGHAIGRIGCFFNGCCYGIPSQWGIYFPVHDAQLLPTQLISSLLLIGLYLLLRTQQEQPHRAGEVFFRYLVSYPTIRFMMEFIRADSPRLALNLTLFQYVCLVLFVMGLMGSIYLKWKHDTSQ